MDPAGWTTQLDTSPSTPSPDAPVPSWTPASATTSTASATSAVPSWTPASAVQRPDQTTVSSAPTASAAPPLEPPSRSAAKWAAIGTVVLLVAVELVGRGLGWVSENTDLPSAFGFAELIVSLMATDVAAVLVVRSFAMRRAGFTSRQLGLRRPDDVKTALVLAGAAWMVFVAFAGFWVLTTSSKEELQSRSRMLERPHTTAPTSTSTSPSGDPTVAPSDTVEPAKPDHALLQVLQEDLPARALVVILLATCIGAPIFEELFFRGFLYRSIAARFGNIVGMVASGLVFGLAHLGVVQLRMTVPLIVLGIVLAWLLQTTGSLLPGMAVHAFVNALSSGLVAGFGAKTLLLIAGSWLTIGLLVAPWLRARPAVAAPSPSP